MGGLFVSGYEEWRRERGCERKKHAFPAEHLAERFALACSWANPDAPQLHPYRCEFCDAWHVTSHETTTKEGAA